MDLNIKNRKRRHNSGFTLLEVLIAIVVFSFGLLGLAGMMTISVRNNHNGYLRTQANFFAENMADRMRANPVGLWSGAYDGTAAPGATQCTLADPCNFNEIAQYDMEQWAQSVESTITNGVGTISCQNDQPLPPVVFSDPPSIWQSSPPYGGLCTVTVSWDESNGDTGDAVQSVVLVVQP